MGGKVTDWGWVNGLCPNPNQSNSILEPSFGLVWARELLGLGLRFKRASFWARARAHLTNEPSSNRAFTEPGPSRARAARPVDSPSCMCCFQTQLGLTPLTNHCWGGEVRPHARQVCFELRLKDLGCLSALKDVSDTKSMTSGIQWRKRH